MNAIIASTEVMTLEQASQKAIELRIIQPGTNLRLLSTETRAQTLEILKHKHGILVNDTDSIKETPLM